MLARLTTWMFYAVAFFLLGAWFGGSSSGLRALMREGAQEAQVGAEIVWQWARSTISEPRAAAPGPEAAAKDLLRSARAAFARGDIGQSISLYQRLLKQEPGNVDARGELGNVLLDVGRLQEASQTYYETALRLAQDGDEGRARALEPIIRRDAPELADRLENELKALVVSGKRSALVSSRVLARRNLGDVAGAATRWRESGAGLAARGAPRRLREPED
jgi:tetratricopeptide (TPR) repeat protein